MTLDLTPGLTYESYSAQTFFIRDAESEGPSLPFGFTPPKDLQPSHIKLPEPWMWWVQ